MCSSKPTGTVYCVPVRSVGGQIVVKNGGSRRGIRGPTEVSEGLTAVDWFKRQINIENESLSNAEYWRISNDRLSHVGLFGEFGVIPVGDIWNASCNPFGIVTNISYHCRGSQASCRHEISVSYGFSNNLKALQIDAVYTDVDFRLIIRMTIWKEPNSVFVSSDKYTLIYVDDGDH